MLKHPNKNIFIKSLIAKKKILFEYSIQIQVSLNKSALANKNIILIPENSGVKKPNKSIIIAKTPKNQPLNNTIKITIINQNNINIVNKKDNPIDIDALVVFISTIAKLRKPYNKYNFDKNFGGLAFIANKNPDFLIYYQIISLLNNFK